MPDLKKAAQAVKNYFDLSASNTSSPIKYRITNTFLRNTPVEVDNGVQLDTEILWMLDNGVEPDHIKIEVATKKGA